LISGGGQVMLPSLMTVRSRIASSSKSIGRDELRRQLAGNQRGRDDDVRVFGLLPYIARCVCWKPSLMTLA